MEEKKLGSYPKILTLGHNALGPLLLDAVLVEEKVDGSQFSFGIINGELFCRSKGAQLVIDAPEKMFNAAVETVKNISSLLTEGYTYRGEYLSRPKHNVLSYSRIPVNNIILFDVELPGQTYLSYAEKQNEAVRLGLEVVPKLFEGSLTNITDLYKLLNTESILGGQKIEGFVVKNYKRFGNDGKVLLGKYVSEDFKEIHSGEWGKNNPTTSDVLEKIILRHRTDARWSKAVQHLKEKGELDNSPKDIGKLMTEVRKDVFEECSSSIKEELFEYAWPKIERAIVAGLAQWYKTELAKQQFEKTDVQ